VLIMIERSPSHTRTVPEFAPPQMLAVSQSEQGRRQHV
jgi:hypothetical protein